MLLGIFNFLDKDEIECNSKDISKYTEAFLKFFISFIYSVLTCMKDPLTTQMEGLVNIDGGGRIFCNMSDCTMKTVQIDTTVEMSFRRIALVPWDTMISYTWKAVPLRENG